MDVSADAGVTHDLNSPETTIQSGQSLNRAPQFDREAIIKEAIREIPSQQFVACAIQGLFEFHNTSAQLVSEIESAEGNVPATERLSPTAVQNYLAMAPTAKVMINRLLSEDVDGGAKLALGSARRGIVLLEKVLTENRRINDFEQREIRMASDFLGLGISLYASSSH